MAKTIEDMEKFVAERKEFFRENIFPITDAIAKAIFESKKLGSRSSDYYARECNLKYNGVHIDFNGHVYVMGNNWYYMTIKYGLFGFRKVLDYSSLNLLPRVFHECEWINKLNGLVEKIQQEDLEWRKKQAYKRYGKLCKNLSETKCEAKSK